MKTVNHHEVFEMNPISGFVQTEAEWRADAENEGWDYDAATLIWVKLVNGEWLEV